MARRIEFQGIANNLNSSFISRNNDFKGYWAIGQLKSLGNDNGINSFEFSLVTSTINKNSNIQNYIAQYYSRKLGSLLRKQNIPESWIREAFIRIEFNQDSENAQLHEPSTSSEPFHSCCQIVDDNGRYYTSIVYGSCLPHSIEKELKSTRKFTL